MRNSLSFFSPVLIASATLVLMLATEPKLSIVWDEGHVLAREARIRSWVRALKDPEAFAKTWVPPSPKDEYIPDTIRPPRPRDIDTRAKLLSARVLAWFWPFAREEPHGHPPFYAIVGMIGDVVAPHWATLPRARLGTMLVFSFTAGAIFAEIRRRWGVWAALASAGAWVLNPHLFALGHYAGYDALLSALWVGGVLTFARAIEPSNRKIHWGWAVAFGVVCGWITDTKLTGWFLPIPFILWTILAKNRRAAYTIAFGGVVAVAVLYAFNPAWWADPVTGVMRFFRSNLSRGQTVPINVLFLGQVVHTPNESLPVYNTLVWTIIASPVGFLVLAILGSVRAIQTREPLATLALGNWFFVLALRALPHTPGHDGVRLFVPAFGCLALVAGPGASWLVERIGRWGKAVVIAAILEGAVSVGVMMPVPLSYASPIVGGLPGAAKIGMEPTYFWDALSAEARDRLARETPPGRTVWFSTFPASWLHLKHTGEMPFGLFPIDPGRPAWFVVQNRPGEFEAIHRRLIRDYGPKRVLVEKFGVPLVWAFSYDEFQAVSADLNAARSAR